MSTALATVEDLELRINATNTTGELTPLLYASLCSTTLHLTALLRVPSLEFTVGAVDRFYVDREYSKRVEQFIRFKLKNGFVNETTNPIELKYAFTVDDFTDAVAIESQYLSVDEDRGFVNFDVYGFRDSFIRIYANRIPANFEGYRFQITYDHGFEQKTLPEGKVYTGVPDWLYEAALIKGREIYQKTNPAKDVVTEDISSNLGLILDPHVRIGWQHLEAELA